MTTKVNMNLGVVVNAVFKAVKSLGYVNGKWWAEYMPHAACISLASIKSGMCITFPVSIKIDDDGVVSIKSEEGDWDFFRHLPEDGLSFDEEITEVLASVLEDELQGFISRYWARK